MLKFHCRAPYEHQLLLTEETHILIVKPHGDFAAIENIEHLPLGLVEFPHSIIYKIFQILQKMPKMKLLQYNSFL